MVAFLDRDLEEYTPLVLRVGLGLIFLWFGFQQVTDTAAWLGWVPPWVLGMSPVGAETIIMVNGIAQLVFALFLFLGLFLRVFALLAAVHMLGILVSVGFNEIGVRDFAIFTGALALALYGESKYSLDSWRKW